MRRSAANKPSAKFTFRQHQSIGAAAAEEDGRYLPDCFVETDDLAILADVTDTRCLLVGRTGAGKSALLAMLCATEDHVIEIRPEPLALNYISNSTIMKYLSEIEVRLDLFFRLLWKHIFCVRLIEERFGEKRNDWVTMMSDRIKRLNENERKKQIAIAFIEKHRDSFWKDTEENLTEIIRTAEGQLQGAFTASTSGTGFSLSAARTLTTQQKYDVKQRCQEIVNSEQVRELETVFDCMSQAFFVDPKQKYFITIDKLDTDWVDEDLRLRLIHALIETSRQFTSSIPGVKVIVALRSDLLEQINCAIEVRGQQREKQNSAILDLRWTNLNLIEVLDKRIDYLVRNQYTNETASHRDVLPSSMGPKKGGVSGINYMLERTLKRPRDVIDFFNQCISEAEGKPKITADALKKAEFHYSMRRVAAIKDEWSSTIRHIDFALTLVRGRPPQFSVGAVTKDDCEAAIIRVLDSVKLTKHADSSIIEDALIGELENESTFVFARHNLLMQLHKVGVIGFKVDPSAQVYWSYDRTAVPEPDIGAETMVHVHPTFWRGLTIDISGREVGK